MNRFCPLASGSKGNALYVATSSTKLLIDAGLSAKMIQSKLSEIDVDLSEIEAIVVTHEHSDHIKGIARLGCKMGIPVFANSDTARGIYEIIGDAPKFKIFTTNEPFEYGDIQFTPFTIQHDAADPVGFAIEMGSKKLGICADLGFVTPLVASHLKGCDVLYIESNHHEEMVHSCPRPAVYKQRVLGRLGHLSNRQCSKLLEELIHAKLERIYLAHLSGECNAPELALEMATVAVASRGSGAEVLVASQVEVSPLMMF